MLSDRFPVAGSPNKGLFIRGRVGISLLFGLASSLSSGPMASRDSHKRSKARISPTV
jgi:hypothetical protein